MFDCLIEYFQGFKAFGGELFAGWIEMFITYISEYIKTNPSMTAFSDIIAFEAVVIAIAIPLSFDIVSRISERYQSEVIANHFSQYWEIKILPWVLISNIVFSISVKFVLKDTMSQNISSAINWIVFLWFLGGIFVLWRFVNRLKQYVINPHFVLEELLDEAEEFAEQ